MWNYVKSDDPSLHHYSLLTVGYVYVIYGIVWYRCQHRDPPMLAWSRIILRAESTLPAMLQLFSSGATHGNYSESETCRDSEESCLIAQREYSITRELTRVFPQTATRKST